MGIGGAFVVMNNARRAAEDAEPTWCEKHKCKCPCHEDSGGDAWFLICFFGSALAAVVFVWAVVTFIAWAAPLGDAKTLVQILVDQWHWLRDLLGRIW